MLRLLGDTRRTLACAESLTGGGVGQRLTSVPGASASFVGSAVVYSTEAKRRVLGVSDEALAGGTVTAACALAMAEGALGSVRSRCRARAHGCGRTRAARRRAGRHDLAGARRRRRHAARTRLRLARRARPGPPLGRAGRARPGPPVPRRRVAAGVVAAGGMSAPERPRLFVAVELPEDVRAAIDDATAPWRAIAPGLPVDPAGRAAPDDRVHRQRRCRSGGRDRVRRRGGRGRARAGAHRADALRDVPGAGRRPRAVGRTGRSRRRSPAAGHGGRDRARGLPRGRRAPLPPAHHDRAKPAPAPPSRPRSTTTRCPRRDGRSMP